MFLSSYCDQTVPYMALFGLCLAVLNIVVAVSGTENDPQVATSSGILTGKRAISSDVTVKQFLGVPYAVPPLGPRRFQLPIEFIDQSPRKTQRFAPSCMQPSHAKEALNPLLHFNETNYDEDCLYLNLYVPDVSQEEPLPVIVWLAGEGFSYSDPSQFDGSHLAANSKVIVVTVNYRVGPFGFLNALNDDAPGNVGLWDQRLALKWIQKNVASFGGNSNKVILCGRFTGAMSVAIQAFSPISKNETLFHRIILHSGVPDGKWIFDSTPLNSVTELAERLECVFGNFSATIECLKNHSAKKLLEEALGVQSAWRPSLDFSLIDETAIDKLIKKKNFAPVDTLIMTNSDEGSLCLTALKVMKPEMYEKLLNNQITKKDFDELIKAFIMDVYKESDELVEKLVSFFYSLKTSELNRQFIEFCGDIYITAVSGKLADALAQSGSKTYFSELLHRPSFSNQPSIITAGHGDDVLYSLGAPLQVQDLPDQEVILTNEILNYMSNFAYYGKPNPTNETDWPVYSSDSKLVKLFDVLPETSDVARTSHEDAVDFWKNIIPNALHKCPSSPMTAALIDAEENNSHVSAIIKFLGTRVSIPAAEYIMTALFYLSSLLLLCLLLCIIIIYRHTSNMAFHRLK